MQFQTLSEKISGLQRQPQNVRNICIMAHVDHGKTTLADALVASNGIISQKMAGKLRYMDSRKDEQERGITMKSSAITLQYCEGDVKYLINLIDSPGHVDFTGEVSSAIQLCDGALILVDVVEGVCAQTKLSIRQAWNHGIKMVLILNKLDRLIMEIKLTPLDANLHLQQILEQVNAVVGELFNAEVLQKNANDENHSTPNSPIKDIKKDKVYDWSSGIDDTDDSNLYFSPDQGNVVFASGIDGWGFRIQHFAKMYSQKLGIKEEILLKTLWGDFYLNTKTKRIMKGAQTKAKKPLFAQFILENVWAVYTALLERHDKEMTEKIVKSLNIKISARDTRHVDSKGQLQSIFNQWIPLANAILEMVCEKLPSPLEISEERAEKLMCTKVQRFDSLPAESRSLRTAFCRCSCLQDEPVIIFVSKLFAVEKLALPHEKPRALTTEEIALKRELARQKHLERMANSTATSEKDLLGCKEEKEMAPKQEPQDAHAFIAFARVFSGTVRKGQQLYVLGPKHDPTQALAKLSQGMTIDPKATVEDLKTDEHITMVTIDRLYILMGRELEVVDEVPAGNVLGIGQLESHVIKTATLSSTIACPPFTDLSLHTEPILRVALEPAHSSNMPALVRGLKLLNQADASVRVLIQETGEHVVVTAGEVHLQRCLDDLRENFAKIEINVSTPIVPFRETIVLPPKVDMVNEAIEGKSAVSKPNMNKNSDDAKNSDGPVQVKTSNRLSLVKMRAAPLPEKVVALLDEHQESIKAFGKYAIASKGGTFSDTGQPVSGSFLDTFLNEETLKSMDELAMNMKKAFDDAGEEWKDAAQQIWAFGPRRCGPNLLLCRIPHYRRLPFWNANNREKLIASLLSEYDNSFVSGFQLATNAGPLCEEPLRGVAFIVEDWTIESSASENTQPAGSTLHASSELRVSENVLEPRTVHEGVVPFGPFSGQIISMAREACRRAFQAQPQRLMAAMYSCNILVTAEVLGKMYAVLGKRHGRVLHGDLQEGSAMFNVTAMLPVIESFNFAHEIRRQTSGQAIPQLSFSHWEVIDMDPFWVPTTDEEYLLFGEKADSENRARKYMNSVRKRKGLSVDEKIVEHAEKQRTLMRKK